MSKITHGVAPPRGARTAKQNEVQEVTDAALENTGEWHSVDVSAMNPGNVLTAAASNIGKAFADVTVRNGVLYIRVKK